MSGRPKIHVFLGAPPTSSLTGLEAGAGLEGVEPPRRDWRHQGLTWQDGRLRPASDGEGGKVRLPSAEERTSRENVEPDPSHPQSPTDETNADQEHWESDGTPEEPLGRKRRAGSVCRSAYNEGDQRPAGRVQNLDNESNPGKEGVCRGSVGEYLDSCFPEAQSEPQPACERQPPPVAPPLSTQTHYLSTWTLAQALILRGVQSAASPPPQTPPKVSQTPPSVSSSTPELFSLLSPSPGASRELFSPPGTTQRMEGGVVIQATTEGVLCSQEEQQGSSVAQSSHSKPPDLKRAQVSENLRMEAPAVASGCCAATSTAAARLRDPTTLLICCDKRGTRYSVLVAVVHPCHLKEVKVRSGPSAGTIVPLASIVVTDQSGVEMKVVLWRRAAFWVLTVSPGDILLITGLQVNEDRWRGETVLQSTFKSKLLNLGQVTASTSPPVCQNVNAHSLSSLCGFLREHRPLLVSLNFCPPQDLNRLPYATLRSLRVNMLVHALLRVTHTHICTEWRSEAESHCRSAVQLKAVLLVEQPNGQQGALLLWGSAVDWLPRLKRDRAAVWDFHVLLVREGLTSDLPELHSTPWSSVQLLDRANRKAQEFFQERTSRTGNNSSSLELDLDTLLSQKYSGDVELRVQVTSFHFRDPLPSQNAPQPFLDSSTSLVGILAALGGDITYTGCGRCCTELDTDANGIYCPCYPCLPHMAVRCYYRPGVLTVSGRASDRVCVQVPPVPLQKILEAPPDKLHRYSAQGSEVKHIQVAAERMQTLLSLPRKHVTITIRSHFLCDENGVAISQDLTLLDLQFPADPHQDQVPAAAVQPR